MAKKDAIILPVMKKDIHPEYFPNAKVTCACGNVFHVGSTKKEIQVEICYACHPFYTGKENLIDTAGRVEKFKARREKAAKAVTRSKTEKRAVKAAKKTKKETKKTKK
jgi:large subunit ribosomal protein L31